MLNRHKTNLKENLDVYIGSLFIFLFKIILKESKYTLCLYSPSFRKQILYSRPLKTSGHTCTYIYKSVKLCTVQSNKS